jgi:hypothetical protein
VQVPFCVGFESLAPLQIYKFTVEAIFLIVRLEFGSFAKPRNRHSTNHDGMVDEWGTSEGRASGNSNSRRE